jgi:hypothetical protein
MMPKLIVPMLYLAAFVVSGARPLGIRVQARLAWSLAALIETPHPAALRTSS